MLQLGLTSRRLVSLNKPAKCTSGMASYFTLPESYKGRILWKESKVAPCIPPCPTKRNMALALNCKYLLILPFSCRHIARLLNLESCRRTVAAAPAFIPSTFLRPLLSIGRTPTCTLTDNGGRGGGGSITCWRVQCGRFVCFQQRFQ